MRAWRDLARWFRLRWTAGELGPAGEKAAARHYRWRGYTILERNLRSSGGEIDLIVRRGRRVVFVEVKTRQQTFSGKPWQAVDREKQLQVVRLAEQFLRRKKLQDAQIRFDVMSLFWDGRRFRIEKFENAFMPIGEPGRPWRWI